MVELAFAAKNLQLRLAGILMDTWIFFLFVAIAGITPGYLKTLLNVFAHAEKACVKSLLERWQGIALPETTLFQILLVGQFLPEKECHFYKFLAIACGFLGKNLFETMIYVCELLTEEPEGGSAMIPLPIFLQLYEYLANLDCSGKCPCVIEESQPSVPSISEESSTLSRLYSVPSAGTEEHEVYDQTEVNQDEHHRHNTPEPTSVLDFHSLDADDNTYDRDDDLYSYYGGEEGEMERVSYDEIDDYEPVGLETILHGICECLEPVPERVPTPPPPDPFEEFVKRMKQEVEEGRLSTRFRVPGIGPQVSISRITAVGLWLADCARRQEGLIGPRNIRHFLCPDLEDRHGDSSDD